MEEIWKTIQKYPNYEVSNHGRVRSITHFDSMGRIKIGQVLKPGFDSRGNYLHVNLYNNGKVTPRSIHRLVANAFIENPHGYKEINHKDEDKTNNYADNLEWCTRKYNNNFGSKKDSVRGVKNPMNKITRNTVDFIKTNHVFCGGTMRNIELARMFDLSPTHVCAIAHGRRWNYTDTD